MRMAKTVKQYGRVYTPDYLVKIILDFGGYNTPDILKKHVIDNSCGNGAFLSEIVSRYCSLFLSQSQDLSELKQDLETYVHGIEIDAAESCACVENLDHIAAIHGLTDLKWDILKADTLTIDAFDGQMDYVFGNPPYVRVHNLKDSYESVKKFRFAESGMTDMFIVFFEIGFNMMKPNATMCLITPSSWLNSLAGKNLRKYILHYRNLSGVIDLEHFQPFEATTYTLISRFGKSRAFTGVECFNFDKVSLQKSFQDFVPYESISVGDNIYLSKKENINLLKKIKAAYSYKYVSVKNGFATLADKVFIGDFGFTEGTIDILKASTGKWNKCIYPYDTNGNPLSENEFAKFMAAYNYLLLHREKLIKGRNIERGLNWYLFGRTQALKDVSKPKYAINTIVKDLSSIKLEFVPQGCGVYSGLYILTKIDFETIKELVCSENFIEYIKLLKNYKSGGYYTFSSKDLEQYLNYKLKEKYGQSRISISTRELF